MTRRTATQVLEAMVAMFDSGDPTDAAQFVADAYLDHQGLGQDPLHGIAGFVRVVEASRAGIEQLNVTVEDLFGSHDQAVARIRWRGRRSDGTKIDRETIDIIRVEDGRAIEHWGAQC